MPGDARKKLDRTPREFCGPCGKPVRSLALHLFCCPAMFPEADDEQRSAMRQMEEKALARTQDLADRMI